MGLICTLLALYTFVLFARIILSWVTAFRGRPPETNPAIKLIYDLTEPVMALFRRYIPPVGGLDLSPIFIFIILAFIRSGIGC